MARKWFVHRSSEARQSKPPPAWPLGLSSTPTGTGSPLKPTPQVRTVVSMDRGDGSRKPKTIITIRRSRNTTKPVPAPTAELKKPSQSPQRLGPSPIASDRLMEEPRNQMFQDDLERCKELRMARELTKPQHLPAAHELLGVEMPASPSSTLRNDTKTLSRTMSHSFSCDGSDYQLSMSSIETSITVIDDGLSPWGLPKTLHSMEDDRYESESDFLSNPKLDLEAELASIDADFKLVRESLAEKSSLRSDSNKGILLHKVHTMVYVLKLVAAKRARDEQKQRLLQKKALAASASRPAKRAGIFSTFASWM